ncbi:MAG: cytochrome c3 family protein [Deltaproteobacteria bacterium]|nr:cytochrome c3 family protein [Deltaproteobacteria bacterium]
MEGKKLDYYFKIIKIVTPFLLIGVGVLGYVSLYPNQFVDVGYAPVQPIAFSHKLHTRDLEISCFYCHGNTLSSSHASIPSTQTCMNCHSLVKPDSSEIQKIHKSFQNNKPIEWIRVHKLADFAHFKHNVHIQAGVDCANCHGDVKSMDVIQQVKPMNMSFCLDCHRGKTEIIWADWKKTTAEKWEPYKVPDQIATSPGFPLLAAPKGGNDSVLGGWIQEHKKRVASDRCSSCHY